MLLKFGHAGTDLGGDFYRVLDEFRLDVGAARVQVHQRQDTVHQIQRARIEQLELQLHPDRSAIRGPEVHDRLPQNRLRSPSCMQGASSRAALLPVYKLALSTPQPAAVRDPNRSSRARGVGELGDGGLDQPLEVSVPDAHGVDMSARPKDYPLVLS